MEKQADDTLIKWSKLISLISSEADQNHEPLDGMKWEQNCLTLDQPKKTYATYSNYQELSGTPKLRTFETCLSSSKMSITGSHIKKIGYICEW